MPKTDSSRKSRVSTILWQDITRSTSGDIESYPLCRVHATLTYSQLHRALLALISYTTATLVWRNGESFRISSILTCSQSTNSISKNIDPNTEAYRCHPRSDIRHPRSDIRHPRSDIRHPTSDIRHPTSDIRHPTSDIRDARSDIRHPTSEIRHPTSDIRHLKVWAWCVVPGTKRPMKWGLKGNNAVYSGFLLYFYHFTLLRMCITPVCSFIRKRAVKSYPFQVCTMNLNHLLFHISCL